VRVLACGSRTWDDYRIVRVVLDGLLQEARDYGRHGECIQRTCRCLTLIEGGQRSWDADRREHFGADHLAGEWADRRNIDHEQHPADWERHGKAAGFIRNQAMIDTKPDVVVAFWDGKSRGTAHTIDRATRAGIPVYVIRSAPPRPYTLGIDLSSTSGIH
jgi:hypothetical protein